MIQRDSTPGERILLTLFLGVCALYCLTPVHNGNFFWHLRNGEDILDSGTVRTSDPFTWTAQGDEWLQQEWLAEVSFALAWRLPGEMWPVVLKTIVILASILLAVMTARRLGASIPAAVLVGTLWMVLSHGRWIERPHIFSILFFSLYLYLMARGTGGLLRSLLIFVPLQILWVNFHAGFIMGYFLLAVWTGRSIMAGKRGEAIRRSIVLGASLLACGVHPNGYRSLTYLPEFLSRPLFRETIREWWSPFHPMYQPGHVISTTAIILTVLLVVTWTLVILRRKLIGAVDMVALGLLSVATVTTSRNMDMLSLAALAWTAPLLKGIRIPVKVPAALLSAAVVVAVTYGVPRQFGPPKKLGLGVDWEIYPTGLAVFLEEHPVLMEARVFNTNEISGYLEYALGQSLPLYMDGRCHLYSEKLYAEYLLLVSSGDPADAPLQMDALDRLDVQLALMDWPRRDGSVAWSLANSPDWAPVYWDRLTVAYAKGTFLDSTGTGDLALLRFDPLTPLELSGTGYWEVPDAWFADLLRAASPPMSSPEPALTCVALELRKNGPADAASLAEVLLASDSLLRISVLQALEGDPPDMPDPRLSVIRAWSLASGGDLSSAIVSLEGSGEQELVQWLEFLATPENCTAGDCNPPPMVPDGAWGRLLSGDFTPGDMAAARASALLACGLQDEAVSSARSVTAAGETSPWSLSVAGGVLAISGMEAEGSVLADSALSLSRNPYTLTISARIADIRGDRGEAVLLLSEAVSAAPLLYGSRLLRADCLWHLGRVAEAMSDYHVLKEVGYLPDALESRFEWAGRFDVMP